MKRRVWLIAMVVLVLLVSTAMLVGCGSNGEVASDNTANEPAGERPAWADELVKGDGKTVLVAADTAYPPFESATADGKSFEGFDVDILNAIGEKLNLKFQHMSYDWDSIIPGMAAGTDFDMICSALTIRPDRAETVLFGEPYFMDSFGMAVPVGSTLTSWKDLTDDHVVAVQTSSAAESWAQKNLPANIKYVMNKDTINLFQAMQAGEADALFQDYSQAASFAADPMREAKVVERVDDTDQYFGMAFQKSPKGEAMRADLNKALLEIAADGTYARIYQKWFGVAPDFLPGDKPLSEILAE